MTFETLRKLADLINQLQLNVDESKTSGMDELGNKIEDKIYFIQEEIKKLSRYNSRLIPSSFQANKVRDLKSESLQVDTYTVLVYFFKILVKQVNLLDVKITSISWGDHHLLTQSSSKISVQYNDSRMH